MNIEGNELVSPGLGAVLLARILMTPMPKLERNETHGKLKSLTTWTTWVQHLPSDDVQKMATVSTATAGSTTLGVAVGPRQFIADQLLAKAGVIRAMDERVQRCQDPHMEFALRRESLGVSRINHNLRVQGHDPAGRSELQKSTMRLGRGLLRGSSHDSRRTAWCKPDSA